MFINTERIVSIVKGKIDDKTPIAINLDNVVSFEPRYTGETTRVYMLNDSVIDINEPYDKFVNFLKRC